MRDYRQSEKAVNPHPLEHNKPLRLYVGLVLTGLGLVIYLLMR